MILVDEVEAVIALSEMTQDSTCPGLTDAEMIDVLAGFKRGSLWTAATAFNIGDRIIPTLANRNGHRYIAISYVVGATDQKTGATEPSWGVRSISRYQDPMINRDAQITDGNIIWQEDGWDWDAVLWDLSGAAQAAWLMKAAKASVTSDSAIGDINIKSSQLFDHCLAMAKQFTRNYIA